MRFGPWLPITSSVETAPLRPGVLQTRAEALLAYPRGRSAMTSYDHSGDNSSLRQFVSGPGAASVARATAAGARFIRWAETPRPAVEHARLLAAFVERFGAAPAAM